MPCRLLLGRCLLAVAPGRAAAADAFESWLHPAQPPAEGFEPLPRSVSAAPGSEVRALARGQVVAVGPGGRPAEELVLLLISHAANELRLYERGREVKRMEVGFGQHNPDITALYDSVPPGTMVVLF